MTTRVVHVNDNVTGAVYIGRQAPRRRLRRSEWANPFAVGAALPNDRIADLPYVIEQYRRFMQKRIASDPEYWVDRLHRIAGKPLACWCRHDGEERTDDNACHGDVLIEMIRELGLEAQP